MDKKPLTTLFCENPATPEGKYLVKRRDGSVPEWPHFVCAAPDPVAVVVLRAYAAEVRRLLAEEPEKALKLGFTWEFADSVDRRARQFDKYREEHGESDPGMGQHRKDDPVTIAEMRKGKSS
jgi:hypothetical protein